MLIVCYNDAPGSFKTFGIYSVFNMMMSISLQPNDADYLTQLLAPGVSSFSVKVRGSYALFTNQTAQFAYKFSGPQGGYYGRINIPGDYQGEYGIFEIQ